MRYMVIEKFRRAAAAAIYERLRTHGRLLPEGLRYVDSWPTESLDGCFQLMETADPTLLDTWIEPWRDLVEFEVIPVISSEIAAERAQAAAKRQNSPPEQM